LLADLVINCDSKMFSCYRFYFLFQSQSLYFFFYFLSLQNQVKSSIIILLAQRKHKNTLNCKAKSLSHTHTHTHYKTKLFDGFVKKKERIAIYKHLVLFVHNWATIKRLQLLLSPIHNTIYRDYFTSK
jgi:hypothetical protein